MKKGLKEGMLAGVFAVAVVGGAVGIMYHEAESAVENKGYSQVSLSGGSGLLGGCRLGDKAAYKFNAIDQNGTKATGKVCGGLGLMRVIPDKPSPTP